MRSFFSLAAIVALGCALFSAALSITIPDRDTLTIVARLVAGALVIGAVNAGVVMLARRMRIELGRPLITANVLLSVILLLFLQNKAMVGTQELQASVSAGENDKTFVIGLRDLAGTPVPAGRAEAAQLAARLAGGDEPVALAAGPTLTGDDRLSVTLAGEASATALRDRVVGRPFLRSNPPRGLFEVPFGIDLRGGVEFICRLYDDNAAPIAADDEVLRILRGRLDQRGLTEPSVARMSNGDVQIVIPGGTPAIAANTRKVIEQTGRLEFREVLDVYEALPGSLPPEIVRKPNGGYDLAPNVRASRKEIAAVEKSRDPDHKPTRFFRLGPAELSGRDVSDAGRTMVEGRPAVSITFDAIGGAKNYDFTNRLYQSLGGRSHPRGIGHMAIVFDGRIESYPYVASPSTTQCQINGSFTTEEVDSLRAALKGGSLAVTPVVLSERVVGATLGAETVRRAVSAMLWSFVGILAFMALYYRRLGVVSVLTMLVTGALIWSTLSIFGATMTLPGLAGLILSVAMSMDTNVLVYERIREEQRAGKDLQTAIDVGFKRAFVAILDSNLTTIFSGIVLYWFGSGPVKGFGLNLAVGVTVSMFSGVYIGRLLTELICRGKQSVSMANLVPELRLPYVRWRRVSYTLSILTAVLGVGYFAFGHLLTPGGSFRRHFDIDFTGGNLVQVVFAGEQSPEEVRSTLAEAHRSDPARFDLLAPGELAAPQAYFSTLGGGGSSRQWIFRGRDEAGAALEAQRDTLDAERARIQARIDEARDAEVPDEAKARAVLPELKAKSDEIKAIEARISERVAVFKRQLAEAFQGRIPVEGSEVLGAEWDAAKRELTLRLATVGPVQPNQATRLREALASDEGLSSVAVDPLPASEGVKVVAALKEDPVVRPGSTDDAVGQRLLALLGANAEAPASATQQLYADVVQAAGTVGVTIAQPFPATQHFSGQVAGEMKKGAAIALSLAVIAMLFYIAARFELGFGIAAVIALAHDVLLCLGLIALFHLRIDLTVVAALLTVIGYSVNDTIVNFDRIRENLKRMPAASLAEVIDISVAQTIPRTVLTGGATILAIIFMMIFAGHEIFAFNAVLLMGTVLGTYSSVFVAAPLLLFFDKRKLLAPEPPAEDGPEGGDGAVKDAEPVPG